MKKNSANNNLKRTQRKVSFYREIKPKENKP